VGAGAAGFDLDHNQQVGVGQRGQQVNFQMTKAQISRDDGVAIGLQKIGRGGLGIFTRVNARDGFFIGDRGPFVHGDIVCECMGQFRKTCGFSCAIFAPLWPLSFLHIRPIVPPIY